MRIGKNHEPSFYARVGPSDLWGWAGSVMHGGWKIRPDPGEIKAIATVNGGLSSAAVVLMDARIEPGQPEFSCPKTTAASATSTGASASAAPSLRSVGCVRG